MPKVDPPYNLHVKIFNPDQLMVLASGWENLNALRTDVVESVKKLSVRI